VKILEWALVFGKVQHMTSDLQGLIMRACLIASKASMFLRMCVSVPNHEGSALLELQYSLAKTIAHLSRVSHSKSHSWSDP